MASDGWSGIRDRAVAAFSSSEKAVWYVCTYRGIPKVIAKQFNIGLIDNDSLLEDLFTELDHPFKDYLFGRQWLVFFSEDIEGRPLTVELRSMEGKEFHRVQSPLARVHPPFFGLSQGFELFSKYRQVAIVEGGFEALTFATVTRFPVLALMTKFPTRKQERFLVRWAKTLHLFLNRDDQGRGAAKRIVKMWSRRHSTIIRNSLWWEVQALGLDKETDLNDLLQQRGVGAVKIAVAKGLKG